MRLSVLPFVACKIWTSERPSLCACLSYLSSVAKTDYVGEQIQVKILVVSYDFLKTGRITNTISAMKKASPGWCEQRYEQTMKLKVRSGKNVNSQLAMVGKLKWKIQDCSENSYKAKITELIFDKDIPIVK